jgi:hypothetical protein
MSEPQESRSQDPGVVEIRIHGVSGTPPTELLNRPITRRVAGDASAGFYRPALDDQLRDRPLGGPKDRGPRLEGFSWSGLTSGSATRALWILLLPFGLINLAPYAVPGPRPEHSSRQAKVWDACVGTVTVLCRVIAGTLTAALMVGACGVGLLTIGTRCGTEGSERQCYGIPVWLTQRLGSMTDSWAWACGLVVPLLVVCLLLLISRRSDRNESLQPDRDTVKAQVGLTAGHDDADFHLARRAVWTSGRHSLHQRGVHARIALTVTGAVASWPLTDGTGLRPWLIVVTAAAAFCDLVLLLWGRGAFGDRVLRSDDHRSAGDYVKGITWGMVLHCAGWVAVTAVGVLTAAAVVAGGPLPSDDQLVSWFDGLVIWGFRAQIGLLMLLVIAVGVACVVTPRRKRLFIRGWSSAIFAISAVLMGAALTSAVMIAVPAWLATPGLAIGPSSLAAAMSQKSSWYGESIGATGFAVAVVTVVVAVVVVGCLLLSALFVWLPGSAGRAQDRRTVRRAYQAYARSMRRPEASVSGTRGGRLGRGRWPGFDPLTRRRAIDVARVFWWARRVDYVPATVAVISMVCVAGLGLVMWVHWQDPTTFPWRPGQESPDSIVPREVMVTTVSWGIWLAVAGLVVLFVISLLATRDSSLRRHIGIVWDVASFWPRDTHPLAPPCYSERAIPQLVCRIAWYTGWDPKREEFSDSYGRVILAGHSQGSVIAAAAVMKLHPKERERVALLTYGSVLSRLYSRFFPRHFGVEELAKLAEALTEGTVAGVGTVDAGGNDRVGAERTRWGNLYRHSDFLGGPIVLKLRADAREVQRRARTAWRRSLSYLLTGVSGSRRLPLFTRFTMWRETFGLYRDREDLPGTLVPQLTGIDALQPDPVFWSEPGDSVFPAANRHSRYDADESFQHEISRLIRMFGPGFGEYDPDSDDPTGSSNTSVAAGDRLVPAGTDGSAD